MPELLGIDNVMFAVADLDAALRFYETCGFGVKFRMDAAGMALLTIGAEAPGLLIRARGGRGPGATGTAGAGRFWVEVRDAEAIAAEINAAGITTERLETATGITVEATDPSGNVVGFADYSKRPELARR